MATEVTDPDGLSWTVRRKWDPRRGHGTDHRPFARLRTRLDRRRAEQRRRARARRSERDGPIEGARSWFDSLELLDVVSEVPAFAVIALVVAGLVFGFFVLLPLLFLLGDLLLLAVVVFAASVGRVLFRRPWLIEARSELDHVHHWEVVGWRDSGDHVDLVATHLAAGLPLPAEGGPTAGP